MNAPHRLITGEILRPTLRTVALAAAAVSLLLLSVLMPALAAPAHAATTAYRATTAYIGGGSTVNVRVSPDRSSAVAYSVRRGQQLSIECQLQGGRLGFSRYAANRTWDRLSDGRYIHDMVTTTPGANDIGVAGGYVNWSTRIPRCTTSASDPTASAAPTPAPSTTASPEAPVPSASSAPAAMSDPVPATPAGVTGYSTTTRWIGGGDTVNVRRGTSTSSEIAYTLPTDHPLTIACQLQGDRLGFSAYANNRTWDRLTDGTYIHDVVTTTPGGTRQYLADGSYTFFSPGIPRCSHGPAAAPAAQSREDRAVEWARSQVGVSENSVTRDHLWSGWCEAFVETAYGTGFRYESARLDFLAQQAAGRVHTDQNAPAGALVFYQAGDLGHVAIAVGDGTVIDTAGYGGTAPIRHTSLIRSGLPYLGWAPAPGAWPGR